MDLIQRALHVETEDQRRRQTPASGEGAEVFDISVGTGRSAEASWSRMVLRAFWVLRQARAQILLLELKEVTLLRGAEKPAVSYNGPMCTRIEVLCRTPLPDSKSSKHTYYKAECAHLELVGRGNAKAAWWTCRECPMRWPRKFKELLVE